MNTIPCPQPGDNPVNTAAGGEVPPGSKIVIEFEPEQRSTTFRMPVLAISKYPDAEYSIKADGEQIFGPAPVPPTDVDDLDVCFIPAVTWGSSIEVTARNLSEQSTRMFTAQLIGWEDTDGT